MNRIIPIAMVTTLLGGTAAFALAYPGDGSGPRAGGPRDPFARLDTNKDGKITRQESQAAKVARFKAIDTNKDGVVTREEADKARNGQRAASRAERFAKMDANKDGRVSKTEAPMPDERFQQLDSNKDGALTESELAAGAKKWSNKRHGKGVLNRLDTDSDGRLTEKEVTSAADRMFERADANKDGSITKEEMQGHKRGPKHHGRNSKRGPGPRQPKAG